MNYTSNFNLRLPERNEQFNLDDWNSNTSSIDSAMQTNKTKISNNATNITSILTGLSTVNTEDTSSIFYKLMKLIYPVGSIYWSGNSTNPGTLFGGTWTQIKDRFVLACGDTYKTVSATGGESSVTLSVDNMPSHNHSFTPSGSISNTTATGTVSSHTHGLNNHTHSLSGNTGGMSANSKGTFVASTRWDNNWNNADISTHISGNIKRVRINHSGNSGGETSNQDSKYTIDVSHTHSLSGNTGGNSGNTTSTQPTFTGTAHNHTFTGTAGNTGSTGSGTSFSILPPYIVKYCWQRTK